MLTRYAMSLLLIALLVAFAWAYAPVLAAAPEPIPECTAFAKIGTIPLYRCPDPDYMIICYVNMAAAGVMTCVEQP